MKNDNYPNQCKCCQDLFNKNGKVLYQWSSCSVVVPLKSSIDRKEGGHLILFPNRHVIKRSDLNFQEAIDLIRASMIIEQAMYDILPNIGINIVNVNIQDSGNLKVDEPFEKRHLHLHFYGRIRDNKNNTHRQFLRLPPKGSDYYKTLISFNKEDSDLLRKRIEELDKSSKFNFDK